MPYVIPADQLNRAYRIACGRARLDSLGDITPCDFSNMYDGCAFE
jgi:hypothetical protein